MEFNVKGITFFRDELLTIKLEEFSIGSISRSHIFHYFARKEKMVLLLRAGDVIEKEFVEKYQAKGVQSFYALEVVSEQSVQSYHLLWKKFKLARSQKSLFECRDLFMDALAQSLREEQSLLAFICACHEEFYNLPDTIVAKYQNTSVLLFTRSLILSSIACIVAISEKYLEYNLLKDIFNAAMLIDFGLIGKEEFSYVLSVACEQERNNPGAGVQYLNQMNRSDIEIKRFTQHPFIGHAASKSFAMYFTYPEVLNFILYHHEKNDGTGFPQGVTNLNIGIGERFLNFCDYLVPYQEHIFKKNDIYKLLITNFEDLETRSQNLPIRQLCDQWQVLCEYWQKQSDKENTEDDQPREMVA